MDPSINVAAGPSNIPRPVINPASSSTQKAHDSRKRRPKRKRIASEASTSVAGDPPADAQATTPGAAPQPGARVRAAGEEGEHVDADADADAHSDANADCGRRGAWSMPWLERLGTTSYESKEQRLHDEIVAFYQYISPSPEEAHVRAMLIKLVSDAVQRRFPQGSVDTFGSVAQNLYLPDGDTDLVITMPESYDDPETKKRPLFHLSALMRHNRVAAHVQVIHRARVPVISFQTLPDLGSVKIDISLNSTDGVRAVPVLRDYFARMPALRFLVFCLKSLLTRHGLNSASLGGLSSYGVICLAISFLQLNPLRHPAVHLAQPLENEALGELLLDFLEYYGRRFDYQKAVVSVRTGRVLTKEEKGWENRDRPHALCIECLINPDNDVGRPTSKVSRIRKLFQDSHAALQAYPFSSAPAAHNVLGAILGVSVSTLAHRELMKDIVTSGRLERALAEVQQSVALFTSQHQQQRGQQPYYYPRYSARPSAYAHGAGVVVNGHGSGSGSLPQRPGPPPAHHGLPPRPDAAQAQRKKYVAQGPSFGALRAAAASANGNGSGSGSGREKEKERKEKEQAKEGNGQTRALGNATPPRPAAPKADGDAASKHSSSPGERSPPRRRRKAQ